MTSDLKEGDSTVVPIEHIESATSTAIVDPVVEAQLVRKLDRHIIPMVMLLYLCSFLDRVNIGNARLYGMEPDLDLKGNRYQTAVSMLFVTYILAEIPSNLVIKKFRPSRWLAFITVGWGIVATLTGVAQSYAGLIVCRLMLGALEGGLFPGCAVYLTLFYTRKEIALRIALLFVSAATAGACGGLLAYAIGHMQGIAGLKGWRWIFIIEGLPTVVMGVVTLFLLADSPQTASYLTPAEKDIMVLRRKREIGHTDKSTKFHRSDVKFALTDWKIYAFCIIQFGSNNMLYGYSTFLPTIIEGINKKWSTPTVQALTIPCYALGAITYLTIAWISDRQQRRGIYVVGFAIISIIGYCLLISNAHANVHYAGCFLVAFGLYVTVGLPIAWLPTNQPRYGKRTTAMATQVTIGNAAGIMSPFVSHPPNVHKSGFVLISTKLYPTAEGPRYVKGNAVTLALIAHSAIWVACMALYFRHSNKRRRSGAEDDKYAGLSDEEIDELGDRSPKFMYSY